MEVRDSVRERRRERIEQIIGQHATEEEKRTRQPIEAVPNLKQPGLEAPLPDISQSPAPRLDAVSERPPAETDPEQWWRERERRLKSGQAPGWQGLKGIPPTSAARIDPRSPGFDWNKLIRGFMVRLAMASVAFAGFWGWLKLEMPGSAETRDWVSSSVTRDMDFKAIEAWYGNTFGGSPSFFPFNLDEPDTKEVSVMLSPANTALPVKGSLVQSFAQNGTGVKVAAPSGSEVYAIYTGRVQQVTEDEGGVTVLVEHENDVLTVYGNLEKSAVKPNDWVETGQLLGHLYVNGEGLGQSDREVLLYFAVQQNGKALNPAEVVSFD
ncbi:M23 family metallopeptidase [Cohnella lupini]|uniref:Murein DD-endopeptidase MepM/ murein hydrolase activator NlpD n=1 Tax=Cohnella lupini TaxID=1294267 RepID=A0A3D9IRG8_9BACL|nr:M23 family metallopeptidase [Cohnella lupini]RED64119.1 murein DD-endopeptidase MepM/ murein hydrolase activator NlpD [Cohnella lupini]